MNTKIEGVLLSKIPYQERHLIASLLLRSGKKISIIFHGGMGGGKKQKASILEIGHMIKVELSRNNQVSDLYTAKEWGVLWTSEKIRYHYESYCCLCFLVEVITKIAPSDDLHDEYRESDNSSVGIFRVLSNAIFLLDRELEIKNEKQNKYEIHDHIFFFLAKLSIEMGVFPECEFCPFTENELKKENDIVLLAHEGAFVVYSSLDQTLREYQEARNFGKNLRHALLITSKTKYLELAPLKKDGYNHLMVRSYFFYLCQQFSIDYNQLKTFSLVFKF